MEWLLKIVEGPMKGAEIALVEGLRVRVGSGEDCDIVLADAALPAEAFALDVKSDSVSFVRDEEIKTLVPFEIFEVGTSSFAIGPAEGAWEPLKREVKEEKDGPAPTEAAGMPPQHDGDSSGRGGIPAAPQAGDSSGRGGIPAAPGENPAAAGAAGMPPLRNKRRGLFACCCALVVLLLFAAAVWFFWPRISNACPRVEETRVACVEKIASAWQWSAEKCGLSSASKKEPAPVTPALTLADLARQYNLVLTNHPQSSIHCPLSSIRYPLSSIRYPLLRGNFARRTERMAVRALALATDPTVKLELTDDESLAAAAEELLFVVTENDIVATSATNGIVTLAGYAPSAASLERTIRALNDDVPGLKNVLTDAVRVGGLPPPKPSEPKQVFAEPPQPAPVAKPAGEASPRRVTTGKKSPALRIYPIAGILTTPYKTVVLENGMRVTEGGAIDNATLVERIEADRLILKSGAAIFEWKP